MGDCNVFERENENNSILFKKSFSKIWSVLKKVVPLHSLSGSNRGEILGCIFMLASWNGKTRSLTDCEHNRRQAARTRIYIIYMCIAHKHRSHSFWQRNTNEQWSRRSCPVRQNYKYIYYSEEFDPGSGWTLATGLPHASRGAAWEKLAFPDGDRRMGESRVSNLPSARG